MAGIFKTYRGGRLDLEFYKGKGSFDYEVEVLNDDDSEFDLSVYDDILLKFFHKIHGTEVLEMSFNDGQVTVYSPADNFVILNVLATTINIRPKEYWYECYGIRSEDGEPELIFFGVGKVI